MENWNHLAGLLTYSVFERLPVSIIRQWQLCCSKNTPEFTAAGLLPNSTAFPFNRFPDHAKVRTNAIAKIAENALI